MLSKYEIQSYTYHELENRVVLPTFQRKLVWSKNEKEAFIDTLHKGYPFGAILIYKYENDKKVSLIDGLQRFTTIRDYKSHPEKYIDFDGFAKDILRLLRYTDELPENAESNLILKIESSIREYISYYSKNRQELKTFIDILSQNLATFKSKIEGSILDLSVLHESIIRHIDSYLDVEKIKIPTIEFKGDVSELATVFENLNRGGQKLSKYQVFAAQWNTYLINLSDSEFCQSLLKITIDRYKRLTETRDLEIENFNEEEMIEGKQINLSEFCYAYGKLILEKMDIFWNDDNEDLANQIGYSTLAIVFNISNKQLNTIIDEFKHINNPIFIEKLVSKTLDVYIDINSIFKKPLKVPGKKDGSYFGSSASSDFQLLSYFASLWNVKYGNVRNNLKIEPLSKYRHDYENIEKNILVYFIYDIVSSKWSGSGDSKLDQYVTEGNNTYKYTLNKDQFENSLLSWHEDIIKVRSVNFEKVSRLLYTVLCSFYSDKFNENKYDCEHIIPRFFLNKIEKFSVPGGTIGNLMYLDINNNRSKKELSLYDHLKPGQKLDDEYFEFQQYPLQQNLEDIRKEIESSTSDYSNVMAMIKNRGSHLLNDLVSKLYKQ